MNLIRKHNLSYPTSRVFDDIFGSDWNDFIGGRVKYESMPALNVKENADEIEMEFAAPGMSRKDFKIEVDNDLLTISSEKKHEDSSKDGDYTRREFSYASFQRTFTLPEWAKGEDIRAKYEDGILRVTVPKKEEAKEKPSKLIDVK